MTKRAGKTETVLEVLTKQYEKEFERLDRLTRTTMTFHESIFAFNQVVDLGPRNNKDQMPQLLLRMHRIMAFCVCYGRLFATGDSVNLDPARLPKDFRPVHDGIIDLRNKRFAHDDIHHSVGTKLNMSLEGRTVTVSQILQQRMPVALPAETANLLEYLSEHLQTKTEAILTRLTKETGLIWKLEKK